jgi:hypothetical protein
MQMTLGVTNIRVLFSRKKQPAQYEEAQPLIEFNAIVEPNQNHKIVAAKLMRDAAELVYTTIGQSDAVTRVTKSFNDLIDAELERTDDTADEYVAASEQKAAGDGQTVPLDTVKKGRGRPRKESTAAAPDAPSSPETSGTGSTPEAAGPVATTTAESGKPDPTTAAAKHSAEQAAFQEAQSTTPSQPTASAAPAVAMAAPVQATAPSDIDAAGMEIINSPIAMQKWVSGFINTKKLGVEQYRGIVSDVSEGKAMKTTDLSVEQRTAAFKKVIAIISGGAAAPKVAEIDI